MIHIFIGTKAQMIKMGPVMRALQDIELPYRFIHSGQHQETMNDLIENFGVKQPDVLLHEGSDITGILQMLIWSIKTMAKGLLNPTWLWGSVRHENNFVLNHGDTFSTLLGTLLARLHGHKAVHVESGLRSFNYFHPFPEEIIRVLTIRLSHIAYAPGDWAAKNLAGRSCHVINTIENTLLDSTRLHLSAQPKPGLLPDQAYGLASIHRFENIFNKSRLNWIVEKLIYASQKRKILFILHKPTRIKLIEFGLLEKLENCENLELRPRYDHIDFLQLVKASDFVITDGGSNQEECHYMGKPCLIFRAHSERTEGLGKNAVLSRYNDRVIEQFLENPKLYELPSLLDGGSHPSAIIAESLSKMALDHTRTDLKL